MGAPLVSVVMIYFNAETFIDEAIASVLDQSHDSLELIAVNDGSSDDSEEIVKAYAKSDHRVRCVAHPGRVNRGMSASRALGIAASLGQLVAFLDADDKWDVDHLETQLAMLERHPKVDLVSAPSFVWESWDDPRKANPRNALPYPHGAEVEPPALLTAILRDGGYAVPICSMLVRRELIERVGGPVVEFKTMFEDQAFQAKLLLAGRAVMCSTASAWYRQHSGSACAVAIEAGEYDPNLPNPAYRRYLMWLRRYITEQGEEDHQLLTALREAEEAFATRRAVVKVWARRAFLRSAPPWAIDTVRRVKWRIRGQIPIGRVRFGDLRRIRPIDRTFGYDRGQPVDRYYIERFIQERAADIRGRVLEIGEDAYTRLFGADVSELDVLHVDPDNLVANVIADLADAPGIDDDSYDCLIVTQTLHLIYDLRAAVATMHRILKPGGVLLLTVPGITQQSDDEWGETWFWSLTSRSARRLFADVFGDAHVAIGAHGNVLSAVSMLHGLSSRELTREELDHVDRAYEMVITVRAVKHATEGFDS
jgi:GT2 family glycosyltransferase/SAM-dependent methyltransferase